MVYNAGMRIIERAMPFVLGFSAIIALGVLAASLAAEFVKR